jgi:hypothetical protein
MIQMKIFTGLVFLASVIAISGQGKLPARAPYSNDFQSAAIGNLPDDIMEIDGIFKVVKGEEGVKYLEMQAEPLAENAVILGPSVKGAASVTAKIRSFRKRRSYPRFAIGLHGISGFRLRMVPSKGVIELVKNEQPVKSVAFKWKADKWSNLQLVIIPDGKGWSVEGRAWNEGDDMPAQPTISLKHEESPGQGKASLWGTAYSGREVQFDDIRILPEASGS